MKLARITVIALAALASPLAVSASEEQKPNEQTLTGIESIRYGRSERSDPNWDRVESYKR